MQKKYNLIKTSPLYLLLFPYIISPLLITHQFIDQTLLIRRTSIFLLFSILLILFVLFKITSNRISNIQFKWIISLIVFIGYIFISSSSRAINVSESYWGIIYLLGWFSICVTFLLYSNQEIMKNILLLTSIIGGILSFLSLLHAYEVFQMSYFQNSSVTFTNRNFWGMYLCFVIPATIFSSIIVRSNVIRIFHILMLLFSTYSLLQSRSRAAWVGILIGLLFLCWIYRKQIIFWIKVNLFKKHTIFIVLICLISSISFFISDPKIEGPQYKSSIWSTLTTFKEINNKKVWTSRIPKYVATYNMISDNLIFGVGYNNWRIQYPKYSGHLVNDNNYLKLTQRPHNDLLWIFSEIGLIGLLLFLIIVSLPIKYTLSNLWKQREITVTSPSLINSFLLVCLISIFVESFFDFPRQRPIPNLYFWSFLGYLSIQLPSKSIIEKNKCEIIKWGLLLFMLFVFLYAYKDCKSNYYSQHLLFYKDNKQYNEAIEAGEKALSYGRNVDNAGSPINFYIGISEYQRKNRLKSEVLFKKSLEISPYHLGTLENYMINTGKNKKMNISLETMEFCKYIYPNYYNVSLNMIKLYLQNNNFVYAKKIISDIEHDIKVNKRLDRYDYIDNRIKKRLKNEIKQLYQYINEKENE